MSHVVFCPTDQPSPCPGMGAFSSTPLASHVNPPVWVHRCGEGECVS